MPFTEYRKDLYPETRITVIANFFYAIMTGALEVIVDEEKIDKGNVVEKFKECRDILESEQDEIDVQHVLNCFQSIETIVNFDKKGRQKLPGFGEIIWYVDDELERGLVSLEVAGC